jgi:hypothetical protein
VQQFEEPWLGGHAVMEDRQTMERCTLEILRHNQTTYWLFIIVVVLQHTRMKWGSRRMSIPLNQLMKQQNNNLFVFVQCL